MAEDNGSINRSISNIVIARAVMALVVMLAHANLIVNRDLFHGIFIQEACGVDFFFVLSGFLVAWLYKDKAITGIEWFKKRFIRIYPAYWIYTALVLLAHVVLYKLGGGY